MYQDSSDLLLIEDDPIDALAVSRVLRKEAEAGVQANLEHASTLRAGLDRLGKGHLDAVLLDLNLPDSHGVETVSRLRESDAEVPIVVFTANRDHETALRALQAGAQDFLVKEELSIPSVLTRSIRYAIERRKLARENARLAAHLHRAEKLASLGVLAGGLATGFNRLLGDILEQADAIADELHEGLEPKSLRRRIDAVRLSTLRAAEIVTQLRDYAVAGNRLSLPIDLPTFVAETSDHLETIVGPDIQLHYDLSAGCPSVKARRLQLYQILLGLVANASEAIDARAGCTSIASGSLTADRELLQRCEGSPHRRPGVYSYLRVSDDGCGIPAAIRDRIFDPFFSTKHAGRGLGLAAVLGSTRELQGFVLVESREGEGTSFTVLFPALRAQRPAEGTSGISR